MTPLYGFLLAFLTFTLFFIIYYFLSSKKGLVIRSLLVFLFTTSMLTSIAIFYYVSENDLVIDFSLFTNQLVYSEELDEENKDREAFLVVDESNVIINDFSLYRDAVDFLTEEEVAASIHYLEKGNIIWNSNMRRAKKVLLDAPFINQLPELPRGCEVTSLAMLLQYYNVNTDKMALAEEIKKDKTPYEVKNGEIYFGDPYKGFVGDMYDLNNPGYGVYHKPIEQLAKEYLGEKVVNITGGTFDHVLAQVSKGRPVWIIINTWYQELPESEFETWITPNGELDITYRLHSVVVTGFDEKSIYFNDPLGENKNRKIDKKSFIDAWNQMGQQAIFILD
ncbi:C39 family peptidase [Evansella sp. AB-P1]|uniref:C39 family peptidase n=1 Tax=Evansella sp. AB-P1 TaxID=3037653 RepID=UPI00241EF5A0|nr:C39 family peptidase [Evansella sp. AB-P1]MDG5787720.1 C39 family peptidase [Evansella sp. AB-P1]